jgi:hypothetical protein
VTTVEFKDEFKDNKGIFLEDGLNRTFLSLISVWLALH